MHIKNTIWSIIFALFGILLIQPHWFVMSFMDIPHKGERSNVLYWVTHTENGPMIACVLLIIVSIAFAVKNSTKKVSQELTNKDDVLTSKQNKKNDNKENIDVIKNCFPSYLEEDVKVVFRTLNLKFIREPYDSFEVQIDNEKLVIPYRIYCEENNIKKLTKLTPMQQAIGFCFFSRHCDGYVRERCIRQVLKVNEKFVIPFILQLLGEYVIEIIVCIYDARESIDKHHLNSFIKENPKYYQRIHQRVYSYWNCYYRFEYTKYRKNITPVGNTVFDYPGIKLLKFINDALK